MLRSLSRTSQVGLPATMGDQPSLQRQWVLLRMLGAQRHGVAVAEAARELGTSQKTIRRDLATFAQVGFPLEETTGARGRKVWCLTSRSGLSELSFAFDEALALYLGRRFFEPLAGTYLWDAAQSAFRKVQACLGRQALAYLDSMCDRLHQTAGGASDYAGKGELVDCLLQAIEERKTAIGYYRSLRATESVEYELHPYGLVWHSGALYLVAYSRDHDAVRHFKVDRFERVEPGGFPFAMPADFRLATHLADSFGVFRGDGDVRVRLRFATGGPARYVAEGRWHSSQVLTPQKDGSLLAEFRLSTTEEIKRWVLSFGAGAEVLEPEELRRELGEEANKIATLYPGSQIAKRKNKQRS